MSLFRERRAGGVEPVPFRTVDDLMTSPVLAVGTAETVRAAAALMDAKRVLHLPVVDERGRLAGLVTYRGILHVLAASQRSDLPVGRVMRADPVVVRPGTPCLRALQLMHEGRLGCLPVVRADGSLAGIVTERDFIRASAGLLETWLRS